MLSVEIKMSERCSTPEDVHLCYRLLLGREPDFPQALIARAVEYPSRVALVSSFIHTLEFQLHHGARLYGDLDVSLFGEFADPDARGAEGFVTDFMGGLTHTSILAWAAEQNGRVEMRPPLGNIFGTLPEWLSVLSAVKRAAEQGRPRFAAAEIGAGWGPWLAVAGRAARNKGIEALRLIGVEPAPELCAAMERHLADNGFDPSTFTVINAAVLPGAEAAQYPMLAHPSIEFGHRACGKSATESVSEGWRGVDLIALQDIVAMEPDLDLLIVTTGGEEVSALASLDLRATNIRSLMVSTHSRLADFELWETLAGAGWRNVVSEPCGVRQDDEDPSVLHVVRDGCQYWVNPRF
jgi:hypothetical protein